MIAMSHGVADLIGLVGGAIVGTIIIVVVGFILDRRSRGSVTTAEVEGLRNVTTAATQPLNFTWHDTPLARGHATVTNVTEPQEERADRLIREMDERIAAERERRARPTHHLGDYITFREVVNPVTGRRTAEQVNPPPDPPDVIWTPGGE